MKKKAAKPAPKFGKVSLKANKQLPPDTTTSFETFVKGMIKAKPDK